MPIGVIQSSRCHCLNLNFSCDTFPFMLLKERFSIKQEKQNLINYHLGFYKPTVQAHICHANAHRYFSPHCPRPMPNVGPVCSSASYCRAAYLLTREAWPDVYRLILTLSDAYQNWRSKLPPIRTQDFSARGRDTL